MPGLSPGQVSFRLSYEISPIYLTGGIAGQMQGGILPFLVLAQPNAFQNLITGGGVDVDLDNFFAYFRPLPGGNLVNLQVGEYPFANQATAANAIITEPLNFSMLMICPVKNAGDYFAKPALISSLKATLDQHNISGGTYTVATPSYLYTDCLLLRMTDASTGESKQAQTMWQLDFHKPLITLQAAQAAQSALMSKISNGVQVSPNANGQITWSGPDNTVGNPASGASPSVLPSSSPSLGFSGAAVPSNVDASGGPLV